MDTLDREEAAYLRLHGNGSFASPSASEQYYMSGNKSDCTLPDKPNEVRNARFRGDNHFHDNVEESQSVATDARGWDIFRLLPSKSDNLSKGALIMDKLI